MAAGPSDSIDAAQPDALEPALTVVLEARAAPQPSARVMAGEADLARLVASLPEAAMEQLVRSRESRRSVQGPMAEGAMSRQLACLIATIDEIIGHQLDAILHHPDLQRLEASWRGLRYLQQRWSGLQNWGSVSLFVFSLTWSELSKDLESAVDFDQSQLFGYIYGELDRPGGKPFGLLLLDHEIGLSIREHSDLSDLGVLDELMRVGAMSFCGVVAGASPSLLGCSTWAEVGRLRAAPRFEGREFIEFQRVRGSLDSRGVALTLPRVLMRPLWRGVHSRRLPFRYEESEGGADGEGILWGSAAWVYAAVIMTAFDRCGWFGDVRGVSFDECTVLEAAGAALAPAVERHPAAVLNRPASRVADDLSFFDASLKPATEVSFDEEFEHELQASGLLPVSRCRQTGYVAFHGAASLNKPATSSDVHASVNARLSSMFSHTLCCFRIAHHLKCMMRDKVGSLMSRDAVESMLRAWLGTLKCHQDDPTPEELARTPLQEADVDVVDAGAGRFECRIHLQPRFQFDTLATRITLRTDLGSATSR